MSAATVYTRAELEALARRELETNPGRVTGARLLSWALIVTNGGASLLITWKAGSVSGSFGVRL